MPGPGPWPPRSFNALGDLLGDVRSIAGRATGGGLVDEQRRPSPSRSLGPVTGTDRRSDTTHDADGVWFSAFGGVSFGGRPRLIQCQVHVIGVDPWAAGRVESVGRGVSTVVAGPSGIGAISFAAYIEPRSYGEVAIYWSGVPPQSGVLQVILRDLG